VEIRLVGTARGPHHDAVTATDLAAFLFASFLLAIVPGQGTAVLLRQSIRGGRRGALATVAGLELGVLAWAIAAALGLSVLLLASEVAYQGLRVVGVVVLLWLGYKALRGGDPAEVILEARPASSSFRSGLLVNLANPKLAVFAISFLPQFVPASAGRHTLLLLALLWVIVDTVWYLLIVVVLGRIIEWLRRAEVRRRLERLSGVVLIGLGIRLALQG
jgi:threonine/homoserine/homoserine lactone efflux protein